MKLFTVFQGQRPALLKPREKPAQAGAALGHRPDKPQALKRRPISDYLRAGF